MGSLSCRISSKSYLDAESSIDRAMSKVMMSCLGRTFGIGKMWVYAWKGMPSVASMDGARSLRACSKLVVPVLASACLTPPTHLLSSSSFSLSSPSPFIHFIRLQTKWVLITVKVSLYLNWFISSALWDTLLYRDWLCSSSCLLCGTDAVSLRDWVFNEPCFIRTQLFPSNWVVLCLWGWASCAGDGSLSTEISVGLKNQALLI